MDYRVAIRSVGVLRDAELRSLRGLPSSVLTLASPMRASWLQSDVAFRKLAAIPEVHEPAWDPPTVPLFKSGLPGLAKNVDEALDGFGST